MDVQMYSSLFDAVDIEDTLWCNETDEQYTSWTNKSAVPITPEGGRRKLWIGMGLNVCAMAHSSINNIITSLPLKGKEGKVLRRVSKVRNGALAAYAFSNRDLFGYLHNFFSVFAQTALDNTILNAVKCAKNLYSGAQYVAGVYDCMKKPQKGDTMDKLGKCVCEENKPDFKCAQRDPTDECCPATRERLRSTPGFSQTSFQCAVHLSHHPTTGIIYTGCNQTCRYTQILIGPHGDRHRGLWCSWLVDL